MIITKIIFLIIFKGHALIFTHFCRQIHKFSSIVNDIVKTSHLERA